MTRLSQWSLQQTEANKEVALNDQRPGGHRCFHSATVSVLDSPHLWGTVPDSHSLKMERLARLSSKRFQSMVGTATWQRGLVEGTLLTAWHGGSRESRGEPERRHGFLGPCPWHKQPPLLTRTRLLTASHLKAP